MLSCSYLNNNYFLTPLVHIYWLKCFAFQFLINYLSNTYILNLIDDKEIMVLHNYTKYLQWSCVYNYKIDVKKCHNEIHVYGNVLYSMNINLHHNRIMWLKTYTVKRLLKVWKLCRHVQLLKNNGKKLRVERIVGKRH